MSYIRYPVAEHEMQRRHENATKMMKEAGIDCLVMYSFDRLFGGALRYLTQQYVNLYPLGGIFSAEGDISLVGWGPDAGTTVEPEAAMGAKLNAGAPYFPNIHYSNDYIAAKICKVIKDNHYKRVGYCHLQNLPTALCKYLEANLPDVEFVDASDMIDRLQAVKSPYELELCQKAVDVQDCVLAMAAGAIRPGRSEMDVAKRLRAFALDMECEDLNVMVGTGPYDSAPCAKPYFSQNGIIGEKDNCYVLVEVQAPGGYWGESGRLFSLSEPSDEVKKVFADCLEIQNHFAEMLVPGAHTADIVKAVNEACVEKGYFPHALFMAHGQGYDIVSRPNFVKEEDMILEENMYLAWHPQCINAKYYSNFVDNFVVTKDGGKRMCKWPTEIIRL